MFNQHLIWQKDLKDPKKAKQIKVHHVATDFLILSLQKKIWSQGKGYFFLPKAEK